MADLDAAMQIASDKYDAALNTTHTLPRAQRKAAQDAAYKVYAAECERALGIAA